MGNTIRLPVRKLVEFILRSGDIDSRYSPKDRMYEGVRIHKALQKKNAELYGDYKSEVRLSASVTSGDTEYLLEGRADGVFTDRGMTVIDEIKSTSLPLYLINGDSNITYWGQAQCYAYIYALQNSLREISVRLTYFNVDTGDSTGFLRTFSFAELEVFVSTLLRQYTKWAALTARWSDLRNSTIKAMPFPFAEYRKGQRELAVSAYRAISGGSKLFAQAPTGTGKTVSVLFPAIKAMGEGITSKIFYLTAKTTTRRAAEDTFTLMRERGLRIKSLTLTAKEKICFQDETVCRPEICPYAKGYFDRANDAVYDAITSCDAFTRDIVEEYALKHTVCPFELSLDISLWADCVICDYNYVFDPRAHLRRFFADGTADYTFLIDEAHNLADRSREMFSSELKKTRFFDVKKRFKGADRALDKALNSINKRMIELRKSCGEKGAFISADIPDKLIVSIREFTAVCERMLKENSSLGDNNQFLQLYFDAVNFAAVSDLYDDRYITYTETHGGDVSVKLFCLDPSRLLSEALGRGRSAVMFSATLTPLTYFRNILGGGDGDKLLELGSPFDKDRLCLLSADRVSTLFKRREQSVAPIAELIGAFVSQKTGNYIVYFPSYKYMTDVFSCFSEKFPQIRAVAQESAMGEEERESFLSGFVEQPAQTLVAFCVLGGVFSEGIDLKGSRLIGAAVVSVGLPQMSVQQDIIKDYFDKKNGMGFEYAYMYPGMNKVLQAAGRVIRCETDSGAVLLIDERFGRRDYARLFPAHWQDIKAVRDTRSLEEALRSFWSKN
ncbi:MAG: ATP-dependent DNA helicase [Clostridiales bacterium]|nr:ATP-dependent DNA helicase [Clostridiales bacterium]